MPGVGLVEFLIVGAALFFVIGLGYLWMRALANTAGGRSRREIEELRARVERLEARLDNRH